VASVTNTYARALADAVLGSCQDASHILQEAKDLTRLVTSSKVLRDVWGTPSIPAAQKRAVLDAIVAKTGVSRTVRNFVAVLIDRRRISFLGPIVKQFEIELNQRLGFTEAEIRSARDLSEEERRALESRVESLTGKKVRASYSRDESVLGGAVVRIGSTIYDGSVKGRLERLREQLAGS
jgi:F-type H+-transporting ATPase subunit delta